MSAQSPLLEPSRWDGLFFNSLKKQNFIFWHTDLQLQYHIWLWKWRSPIIEKIGEKKSEYLFDEVPSVDGQVWG